MSQVPKFHARDIAFFSEDEIWELPRKYSHVEIEFDDKTEVMKSKQTLLSWYIWEFHRQYERTPLYRSHHIGNSLISTTTHLKMLGYSLFDCWESYTHDDPIGAIETLCKLAYEIHNQMYNVFTTRLGRFVDSVNAVDFAEVMANPTISLANSKVHSNNVIGDYTIAKVHAMIVDTLLNDPKLDHNPIAIGVRAGVFRAGQVQQCVGPRGYPVDIDNNIFKNPILTGFVEGMGNLEDQAKESRSAAMALFFSKKPMQDSEYFNRNIQLAAAILKNLHYGDCGSTDYIDWHVGAGDVSGVLKGIYHFDGKKLARITEKDIGLVGKTIKIRNVFSCKHPDRYGICSTCFGDMALSVPKNTNIGHFSSTQLLSIVGQALLSVKHEVASAIAAALVLYENDKKFLEVRQDSSGVWFTKQMVGTDFKLIIPAEAAANLIDVSHVDDVRVLVAQRITDITDIVMEINTRNAEIPVGLSLGSEARKAFISHDGLEYIKKVGWSLSKNGEYVIDMKNWDNKEAFFETPVKSYTMVEFQKELEGFIKGTVSKKGKSGFRSLVSFNTQSGALVAEALQEFHQLVSMKVGMNLSHLQVICLTTMIESMEDGDFRVPAAGGFGKFNTYRSNMKNRSLSAAMAFQDQAQTLQSVRSYLPIKRPPHPLDDILIPRR